MVQLKSKNKQEEKDPKCLQHLIDQDAKWVPQKLSISKYDKILFLSPNPDETMPELTSNVKVKIPTDTGYLDSKMMIPFGWKVGWKKWKQIAPSASSSYEEFVHFGCWYSMWDQDNEDVTDYIALKQYCNPPLKRLIDGRETKMDACRVVSVEAAKLAFFASYDFKAREE